MHLRQILTRLDHSLIAFLWAIIAVCSFCIMAVSAREVTDTMPVFTVMSWRIVIMLACISVLVGCSPAGFAQVKTQRIGMHIQRNCWHIIGQGCWIWGIALIPLAQVFALEFTTALWVALAAPFFLKERLGGLRIAAIIIGFAGALIILRPGLIALSTGSLIVMVAAVGFAGSMICTKKLAESETTLAILFYMAMVQLPIACFLAFDDLRLPVWEEIPALVFLSLGAISAHFSLTSAYRYASPTFVGTIDFLRIPMIAIAGYWLYDEHLDQFLAIGTAFMVFGNYLNLRSQNPHNIVGPKS
ncbi:MAG: DMT family transporter [Pseudomonadota bacterium]